MASKDIRLIQQIFHLLKNTNPETHKKIAGLSHEFVDFFQSLIPAYKQKADMQKKGWKGEIVLWGSGGEQDGHNWSNSETADINGSIKLTYRHCSLTAAKDEEELCIAEMAADENTLMNVFYQYKEILQPRTDKKKETILKDIKLEFENNVIKRIISNAPWKCTVNFK